MTAELGIAVHALVFLDHKQETVSSELIAENVCTNPARIRKIMSKLKRNGLVETREGAEGGYHISKDAKNITLREVCEAVDTPLVSANWRSGRVDVKCMICSGMADIMDDIYSKLNETCKEELSHITIADINQRIFEKKGE